MSLEHILTSVIGILLLVLYFMNGARKRWKELFNSNYSARFAELKKEIDELSATAEFHKRRGDEFFSIIQGIETERDTWKRFYEKASHHAGVAQAWLLRDLSAAVQVANAYASRLRAKGDRVKDIALNPALGDVVREFGLAQDAAKDVKQAPGFEAAKAAEEKFTAEAQSVETGQ